MSDVGRGMGELPAQSCEESDKTLSMCPAADMGSDWGEQDERSLAISFSLHSLSCGSCDDDDDDEQLRRRTTNDDGK